LPQSTSAIAVESPLVLDNGRVEPYKEVKKQMRRLGWSKSTTADFMKEAFQKSGLEELSDNELDDFISMLKSQPVTPPTPKAAIIIESSQNTIDSVSPTE
jgi:hypothetical protein